MTAIDLQARLTGWAMDEVSRQCLGQDCGVHVACWPTQAGPVWHLLLTCRSPLLGQGPNLHIHPLAAADADEETVRKTVSNGLMELRKYGREQLAGANGKQERVPG